ncbi:hypothetical protein K466DRAFT_297762 [Polyporus arcularius HHB13444]|uniref:Uncharacterized protein n=1 Tax=Polyporus arcularius HHB13444 TaxID=1314778 RepID=A0A5C3NZ82_9APHY|nr:hypothetical protein K466DRAFT_297762 [Polyporus arcularius HHB13444]
MSGSLESGPRLYVLPQPAGQPGHNATKLNNGERSSPRTPQHSKDRSAISWACTGAHTAIVSNIRRRACSSLPQRRRRSSMSSRCVLSDLGLRPHPPKISLFGLPCGGSGVSGSHRPLVACRWVVIYVRLCRPHATSDERSSTIACTAVATHQHSLSIQTSDLRPRPGVEGQ